MDQKSHNQENEVQPTISTFDRLKDLLVLEEQRIASFEQWPFGSSSSCSKINMAKAGFYWTGTKREPDTATCFVCNKTLDGWEETDEPLKEHAKHAPQCEFVKLGKEQNVLTVREFLIITKAVIKNKMMRNLEKEKADYQNSVTNEIKKFTSRKL